MRKDIFLPGLFLQHLSKGSLGWFQSLGLAREIETMGFLSVCVYIQKILYIKERDLRNWIM